MESTSFSNVLPSLTFREAVSSALKKYATFSGRSRRSEYWWFVVFYTIVMFVAVILDFVLGLHPEGTPYGVFYYLSALGLLIPSIAVLFRRLHDIGKSGWNWLWALIPLVGSILLLIWCCQDSQTTSNKYGASPKYQ